MLAFFVNANRNLDSIYLGVDDDTAPAHEVQDFLAEKMGVPRPPRKTMGSSENDALDQNKRINNARVKNLGFRFKYPSYKDGYPDILKDADLLASEGKL
jgi:hypothetical protein